MATKGIEALFKARTSEATSDISKLSKSMLGLKSATLLSVQSFVGLVKQVSKLTDATDSYNTSVRLLKSTLGSSSETATEFIHKLGEMSGISTATLNRQTAKFVQLGESLSFSNEQAEKFSENLSVLSTKLALLYNMDYETMANSLQKAVQGSQVTLKSRTGIAINDVSLQATLNANAINREVSSLNDAEKAIVRYATILRQVTDDTSVYQDAVNSLAWQKQMLSYQMKKLAAVTGQLLTPALTQLYIVMNGVIMAAIEIIKVLGSIFNINMDLSAGVSSASDGFDNLGSSIGKASSAAKKSLRGFDKLNNITTPSAGGTGGGGLFGIDNSILRLLDEVDDQFFEIQNKATEIKNQILKWLGINEDLSNAKDRVKEIFEWAKMIGAVLLGWKVSSVVASIFKTIGANFGLGKTIGLTLTIASLIWAFDAGSKLENGEVTSQTMIESIASTIGAGVGAGMLTASAPLGFTVAAFVAAWELSSFGEGQSPDWVKFLLGHKSKFYEDAFLKEIFGSNMFTVSINIYEALAIFKVFDMIIPEDIKKMMANEIISMIKDAVWEAAEVIKKIPVIGYGIGSAIQAGIRATEQETQKTLEQSTEKAIDKAKPEINENSENAGREASMNYMTGMRNKFDEERENLKKKIETTIDTSSTNANNTFIQDGNKNATSYVRGQIDTLNRNIPNVTNETKNLINSSSNNSETTATQAGNKLANAETLGMGNTIINSKEQLRTKITGMIAGANNNVDTSSSANLGGRMANNLQYGFENQNLEYYLGRDAANIGETIGDEMSNNMVVNNSTLGRTLNSAVSSAISRIKNNNWSLFGSGGFLSDLFNFRWTYFADGGFPTEGEMFIAREAGAEMVGSINGHTAVANNDQIVKGIQAGVFNAMMSALSSTDFSGSNVTIEASGDTEGLLNFIEFKQKQKSRQFN